MTEVKLKAVITGAAGGIGMAAAERFRAEGWSVTGVDIKETPAPDAFDEFVVADVSEESTWTSIGEKLNGSGLDALVSCAALQISAPLAETSPSDWDRVMAVNVRSIYLAVKALHSALKKSKGSIVSVSSVHQFATSANIAAYAASKGAVGALTRALAVELANDGIRVNAVAPGAVETDMLLDGLGRGHLAEDGVEAQLEQLASQTVMGRIGLPQEIAEALLFLADNSRSSFMTGETMVVDGGALARLSTE